MDALELIYKGRQQVPTLVAWIRRAEDGHYEFEYSQSAHIVFPGFPRTQKVFKSQHLWEIVRYRVPAPQLHDDEENEWKALKLTRGRLATDHFELRPAKILS